MEYYIKNVRFKNVNKYEAYYLVTLVDEKGNVVGTFGNKKFSTACEFRKATFGIMAAVDCFDLTRLGSDDPNKLNVCYEQDKFGKVLKIFNDKGISLSKNNDFMYVTKRNIFARKECYETIENIISSSGTFSMLLTEKPFYVFYVTGNVYYGFGYPLFTTSEVKSNDINEASLQYLSYIRSILRLYSTKDLMMISRVKDIVARKVDVVFNHKDDIVGIGNKEKDIYLINGENTFTLLNEKMLHEKVLKLK